MKHRNEFIIKKHRDKYFKKFKKERNFTDTKIILKSEKKVFKKSKNKEDGNGSIE